MYSTLTLNYGNQFWSFNDWSIFKQIPKFEYKMQDFSHYKNLDCFYKDAKEIKQNNFFLKKIVFVDLSNV